MFTPSRFLVPVDFSSESELALEWAMMMAKPNAQSSIHLMHVVHSEIAVTTPSIETFGYLDIEREVAEKRLREWLGRIPNEVLSFSLVREGRPAEEIATVCAERKIDLVVMTTHGRKGLSHLMHGSVAEETVRLAACPVLVLHLNQAAREVAHAGV